MEMPAKAFHLTKWNPFIKLLRLRDAIILVVENDDNTADFLEAHWVENSGAKRKAEMSSDELNLVEGAGLFALVPVGSIQADRVHFPTARFHFTQAKCRSKQHDFT